MTDFDRDNPPTGGNRALIPAEPVPSTPTPATPPPYSTLEELQKRWIDFADVSEKSIEIYASATKKFLLWLADNQIPKPSGETTPSCC